MAEKSQFTFIDLFAGLGGFHIAMRELGGEAVFAAEWEPELQALYKENYGLEPWGDVNELDEGKIKAKIKDHDVLCAGFPCQPFSKAGAQQGFEHSTQGKLFFKVVEILEAKKPKAFILENVPNILTHDNGETKRQIVDSLEELGYVVDVHRYSPHQFGIPQIRDRAYFIGVRRGGDDAKRAIPWEPPSGESPDLRSIIITDWKQLGEHRPVPETANRAIDMWGDFITRSAENDAPLPSFPLWSMEFGATYPYEDLTPPLVWEQNPAGFEGKERGSFGKPLKGLTIAEQKENIPSHSRRDGDHSFPTWKRTFIRQNRKYYETHRHWIDPWLKKWRPAEFPSSFQKFEWNAQGEERVIDNFVIQVRASGIRVKRPTTSPSLIAFTHTQVPILGRNLSKGERRYMTPRECAHVQSLGEIELPKRDLAAYKALGNAVNAKVVETIFKPVADEITKPRHA